MLQEFFPVLEGVPMGDLWILLFWGVLILLPLVLGLWIWLQKSPRSGAGVFSFSFGAAILGVFYAAKGDGYGVRRLLMGTLVFLWGAYLLRLFWVPLDADSETEAPLVPSFLTLLGGAILAVFLSIPFALLAIDPWQQLTLYEWLGLLIWIGGMAGHIADDSRCPLFEWVIWIAYCVAALATPFGAWTVLCPLVLLIILKPFQNIQA